MRTTLVSKIDEVLEFLASDGNLHSIEDISRTLNIPSSMCKKIIVFLVKYGFVQFEGRKLKIDSKIRDLMDSSQSEGSTVKGVLALAAASSLGKTEV
jgi:DNA-binding IclR family transcriptional regulator